MRAFSLFEILIALVIVGVLLTFADWSTLLGNTSEKRKRLEEAVQLKILLHLTDQASNPAQPLKLLDLKGLCDDQAIYVGAGGVVEETQIRCNGKEYSVSTAGRFYDRLQIKAESLHSS